MAKPEAVAISGSGGLEAWETPILMIGCGAMAGAILARWIDAGLQPDRVTVVDPNPRPLPASVRALTALPDGVQAGGIVLLGIKPQAFADVAPTLAARLPSDATMVSMLAGMPLAVLHGALPSAGSIVRIMPNLPARWGRGVILACSNDPMPAPVAALLAPLGLVEPIDEAAFDLGTAVSGCGPAFVYRFIDALAGAGASLGLDAQVAARLALHTVAGAAGHALRSIDDPAALADAVASPGGMTREGLDVLDADGRLARLLADTLAAARDRGAVLAAGAVSARPGAS